MRTTDKIGFKLIIREPDMAERTVVVCPRYNDLKLKWSRPSGKMYYQKELSGNIKFWGVDFNTIYGCALRTKFVLLVYDRRKGVIARCEFRKTDCKWDINHSTCDVDVSSWNPYKKIEAGKDNEYNLVKMGIEKHTLNMYVYPQNQIYLQDDNTITLCSYNGASQAQVSATHDHDKLNLEGFDDYLICGAAKMDMTISGYGHLTAEGKFSKTFAEFSGSQVKINDYRCISVASGTNYQLFFGYYEGSATIYQFYKQLPFKFILALYGSGAATYIEQPNSTRYDALYGLTSVNFGSSYAGTVATRIWITYAGTATIQDTGGRAINGDDITAEFNNNYRRRIPNLVDGSFIKSHVNVSNRTSSEPTEYGMVEGTNTYYNTPDDTQKWFPVRKDSWFGGYSMWVGECFVSSAIWESEKGEIEVQDFYALGDAIKAVLHEIDPDLHFEPDTTHSQFLFSEVNPVGESQQGKLYISQKSNVLNLGYDYPAWQAPITWGRIETLLNNAFNCYWEIYEQNGEQHLRIEHRTYFENGGTYNGSSLAETIDLRSIYRTANRTRISDKTNRWEWDKDGGSVSSNANRYEYGWMDTQSAIFDGETIEVPESYQLFEDERVDERKVDWFSSDIDFLTSVQAECSSDGFVLVMENLSGNGWIIGGHPNYTGQNYQLSLEYLQPLYLLTGIYSAVVKIGDTEYPNQFTSRMRKAEIEFKLPEGVSIEAGDILWTEVGKGVTETLEQDINSDKWTATVRYENE